MKKLVILLFPVACYSQDSTAINQEVFFSPMLSKYVLVTNNGSSFDSVIHGTLEFVEANKRVEFEKALKRRKGIVVIKAKCK